MAVLTRAEPGEQRRTGGAPRRIERRESLPGGRAVVGGLLVGLAAVGTFAAWQAAGGEPTTDYVVAARDVGVGERLVPDDLDVATMDLGEATAAGAFTTDASSLVLGQITVAPLAAGDLVQRSAIVVPDDAEARRQLSFPVEAAHGLAGSVERGEVVDVVVSSGDGRSRIAVAGAVVADIQGDELGGGLVVLVSVPADADVVSIAGALHQGDITLVRATGAPPLTVDQPGAPVDGDPGADAPVDVDTDVDAGEIVEPGD